MASFLETLRKNYESYDDERLVGMVTDKSSKLVPEARELLKRIILERGLAEKAGLNVFQEQQFWEFCALMRSQPCPICNLANEKLNATMTYKVSSMLVVTFRTKKVVLGCPSCLNKANNNAMFHSAAFGWWGFPWGIIRTIQSFSINRGMKWTNRQSETSDYFRAFVYDKIARIEANKDDPKKLQSMLRAGI